MKDMRIRKRRDGVSSYPSCLSSWLNLKSRYSLGLTINVIISIPGRKDLWTKVVEKIKEADEIEVFVYKFRRMMEGHLYLDEKPLIEIIAEINSQEFGEIC